ncbi:MAG TPA: hypothetical protein VHU42_00045 [Rhodopila sp.]|jgi:hypothetical protein|nr:hypothetical protein [Rhodopila sp.]
MTLSGNLLAWIEPSDTGAFIGAFVGEGATSGIRRDFPGRAPATRHCSSVDDARQWVEEQAAALDIPIRWLETTPQR